MPSLRLSSHIFESMYETSAKYTAYISILRIRFFFGRLECVGHSFAYVAHFVFLRDVRIRTQRAVASRPLHLSKKIFSLISMPLFQQMEDS
jgi:hypothetical protein